MIILRPGMLLSAALERSQRGKKYDNNLFLSKSYKRSGRWYSDCVFGAKSLSFFYDVEKCFLRSLENPVPAII